MGQINLLIYTKLFFIFVLDQKHACLCFSWVRLDGPDGQPEPIRSPALPQPFRASRKVQGVPYPLPDWLLPHDKY